MVPNERTKRIVCNDLDSEFIKTLSNFAAWEYSRLYDDLAHDTTLLPDMRVEAFARGRSGAINKALVRAAQKHGVPFETKRLSCNGQTKLLLKAGRVILFQEPLKLLYGDKPKAAAYKQEISRFAGMITQLELDLGDRPIKLIDWHDSVLAVVLHGASGTLFKRDHCSLGAFMLGIPDDSYSNWMMRLDLHNLAMFGGINLSGQEASEDSNQQEDRVVVRKRQSKKTTSANG